LKNNLQIVISKLLDYIHANLMDGQEERAIEWMKVTSWAILCEFHASDFGPGLNKDDVEDKEALLSYATVCRMLPQTHVDTHPSRSRNRCQKIAAQFKSIFSFQALHFIFLDADDRGRMHAAMKVLEDDMHSIVAECEHSHKVDYSLVQKSKESLAWFSLCSSLASVAKLNTLRVGLEEQAALCLAVTEISLDGCMHAAMQLFKGNGVRASDEMSDNDLVVNHEYGSKEEAGAVAHLLSLLNCECNEFISRISPFSNFNLLFQRASYFVQCSTKYFGESLRRVGEGDVARNSLDGWLKRASPGGKVEEDDDDDSDEGEPEDAPATRVSLSPAKKQRLSDPVAGQC
jgi:hypothetical protein